MCSQCLPSFMSFCEIRYRRGASGVRNMHSVQKAGSWCTRGVFKGTRCKKQASTVPKGNSVLKKGFWCTEVIFGTGESLLLHRTQLQKRETPSCCTECIFSARNGLREKASKHKKRVLIKVYQDFLDPSSARTVAAACVYCGGGASFKKNVKKRMYSLKMS